MALDPVVQDALAQQVTRERTNQAAYMALDYRFQVLNLDGFAGYCRKAALEEGEHAQKFADYLIDREGVPVIAPLNGVNAPQSDMLTAGAVLFGLALQVEKANTEAIKTLHELAEEADDPQTCSFLIWALDEQTSAERELTEMVARCKFAEGCPAAILALDHEMGG